GDNHLHYGIDGRIAKAGLYAIASDHLNTPRRLTNQQGQVAWQWLISGYGEVAPTIGNWGYLHSNSNRNYSEAVTFELRYPGQQWDEETGLAYNLHRYYDALTGRYIQADPIGLEGGWNRFGYVGGNPLNATDPNGLNAVSVANWLVMQGQGLYYRYGPAITTFIAGASGVNGAVVSPMSPLVAQIPTTVSRLTPVARAVAEGIESGGFCAAKETTRVGRWMSGTEFKLMNQTGRVVEGAGGRTYVLNPANPSAFTSAGKGSSVYAEFDVPTSVLRVGSKPEWSVIPGPNVTTRLYGPAPTELAPATCIVCAIGNP
ncbi:MAG: hypothetical protein EON54_25860, partial [Alcaligenaceae bacterium]